MIANDAQPLSYLDRIEPPFLYIEEREVHLHAGGSFSFENALPKVLFVLEGSLLTHFDDGPKQLCSAGDCLINMADAVQTYACEGHTPSGYLRVLRLTFIPTLIQKTMQDASADDGFLSFCLRHLPRQGVLSLQKIRDWEHCLATLLTCVRGVAAEHRIRVGTTGRYLLTELAIAHQRHSAYEEVPGMTAQIVDYLESHMGESITLDQIGRFLDRTPEHLARCFKRDRGHTIFEALRQIRIEKAKFYLLCTNWPIHRVADECGFSTTALFSRSFRADVGSSPREFRRQPFFPTAGVSDARQYRTQPPQGPI